jgi:hypothetical protein
MPDLMPQASVILCGCGAVPVRCEAATARLVARSVTRRAIYMSCQSQVRQAMIACRCFFYLRSTVPYTSHFFLIPDYTSILRSME